MGGGDIAPHTDSHLYSSHGAAGFSSTKGYRRGYYGEYQFDIPRENTIRVLDSRGDPAAGVEVSLYQRNGPIMWPGEVTVDDTPEFTGMTDGDGRVRLANRQIIGGPWATRTGHVLRDNPFGVVDIIGGRNRFLVKLGKGAHEEFAWLDITDFNLAYWAGDTESHTFTREIACAAPRRAGPAAGPRGPARSRPGHLELERHGHSRSDRILCLRSRRADLRVREDQRPRDRHQLRGRLQRQRSHLRRDRRRPGRSRERVQPDGLGPDAGNAQRSDRP